MRGGRIQQASSASTFRVPTRSEIAPWCNSYPADGPGGHANQQWKLIPIGTDGYVYIASALDNDLVLDVRGGEGAAGTKVEIYKRGDKKPNQMWIVNPVA